MSAPHRKNLPARSSSLGQAAVRCEIATEQEISSMVETKLGKVNRKLAIEDAESKSKDLHWNSSVL